MSALNKLEIIPTYNTKNEITGYSVICEIPRWLEGLDKWAEWTMLYHGTEEECKTYVEWYSKEVVPENGYVETLYTNF